MAPQAGNAILIELIKRPAVLCAVEVQQYKRLKQKWKSNQVVVNLSGVVTLTAVNVPNIQSLSITVSNGPSHPSLLTISVVLLTHSTKITDSSP